MSLRRIPLFAEQLPTNVGRNLKPSQFHQTLMTQIIAPCGIDCVECEAYKATKADDWEELARIAESWSEDENTVHEPKDMLCDGCFGPRINGSCVTCDVRKCALNQGFHLCSNCEDYTCPTLEKLWKSFSSHDIDDLKERLLMAKFAI